ncbi:MAG: DUF2189 domain-containing protein [Alphaproteobacteria bacterium]|nr:MAG: DUF2189 domain-containing protein [Alphaproteobacteria bacterium]
MEPTANRRAIARLEVNTLSTVDLTAALSQGFKDFRSAPKYGLFFGGAYALCGWLIYAFLAYLHLHFLVYPLFIGFALIAPFMATGFYDVSRKLKRGLPLSWSAVLTSVRGTGRRDLGWMALITCFVMIIWMDIAALLFFGFMGLATTSAAQIIAEIFTTPTGLIFLTLGCLTGAMISFFVFSITVISFPLLYDRDDIDFVTAMITSVKTVRTNPGPMILWYMVVGLALLLSLATLMIGLFIALPVLGHGTWHLYRRAIG